MRNPWLDVCRATAIGLVMLSHGRFFVLPLAPSLNWLKFGGFLGVELFFVLSGFLIGGIMLRELGRAPDAASWVPRFWARRWLRTLPNYLLFLAINAVLYRALRSDWPPSGWSYITFTQNILHAPRLFFVESWSLAVEEAFYLITPVLVVLACALGASRRTAVYVGATAIILFSVAFRWYAAARWNLSFNDIRGGVAFRLDAIMIGVLVAVQADKAPAPTWLRRLAPWIAIFFVGAAIAAAVPDSWLDQGLAARLALFPLTSIGCAGVIMWRFTSPVREPVASVANAMAKVSYSAYLTNLPVLSLLHLAFPQPTALGCVALWFAYVAGTFATATVFYRLVEKPILAWRDRRIGMDASPLPRPVQSST
ncbi:acyltransferase [Bacillus sp. NP157]|nr:acyltransferase [Bacillus sp. NP157]